MVGDLHSCPKVWQIAMGKTVVLKRQRDGVFVYEAFVISEWSFGRQYSSKKYDLQLLS